MNHFSDQKTPVFSGFSTKKWTKILYAYGSGTYKIINK